MLQGFDAFQFYLSGWWNQQRGASGFLAGVHLTKKKCFETQSKLLDTGSKTLYKQPSL